MKLAPQKLSQQFRETSVEIKKRNFTRIANEFRLLPVLFPAEYTRKAKTTKTISVYQAE